MSGDEHLTTPVGNNDLGWYDASPESLTVQWKPELLTNNSYDRVDINFIGYREVRGKVRHRL